MSIEYVFISCLIALRSLMLQNAKFQWDIPKLSHSWHDTVRELMGYQCFSFWSHLPGWKCVTVESLLICQPSWPLNFFNQSITEVAGEQMKIRCNSIMMSLSEPKAFEAVFTWNKKVQDVFGDWTNAGHCVLLSQLWDCYIRHTQFLASLAKNAVLSLSLFI